MYVSGANYWVVCAGGAGRRCAPAMRVNLYVCGRAQVVGDRFNCVVGVVVECMRVVYVGVAFS